MLVEKAGGKTSDGVSGKSCLDIKIDTVDQVKACYASLSSRRVVRRIAPALGDLVRG